MAFSREFRFDDRSATLTHHVHFVRLKKPDDPLGHRQVIAGRNQESCFAFDDCFARATDVSRDNRKTGRHVFEYGVGESFCLRAKHSNVGSKQQAGNIVAATDKENILLNAEFFRLGTQIFHQYALSSDYECRVGHTGVDSRRRAQKHRMILHGIMQVRNDCNEAAAFRQTKLRTRFFTRRAGDGPYPIEIQSVVVLHDPRRVDTFRNQLISDHLTVSNDAMGHVERSSLRSLLHGRAKAVRLTFRSNTRGDTRPKGARHAENVSVETVTVNNVDFLFFHETREAAKLLDKIQIVEAGKRVFVNCSQPKSIGISTQRATVLQTCQVHTTLATLMQLPQELQSLTLATALLKTIDDE